VTRQELGEGGIIALKKEGEQKMVDLICPKCHGVKRKTSIKVECEPQAKMWGIVQCLACGHELPITMHAGFVQKLDIALPGAQSDHLNLSVPSDIKEDVQEAERANYAQCYKACVTMCRRALQLGLIDKAIPDAPLSTMLKQALDEKLIEQKTFDLATSIKGYGDIGAHRKEQLEPQEVTMVIYATVRMLNELLP